MSDTQKLLHSIQPDIDLINKEIASDLDELAPELDELLVEILRYGLLGGGKRFRPLLAVMAARLCGARDSGVYRLAISFEYLHMATLIHDDVIDNSANRRGKPSVFKKFGLTSAILAGDFLHARSMSIVGKLGGYQSLDVFCKATSGMVDGEFLQMRNTNNHSQSEEEYFNAIQGKTALLISATAEIGALFAGAGTQKICALKRYGDYLGAAFQVVDDLLDYMGDEDKTGKPVGNDLIEGKMTLPLIHALNTASQEDSHRLLNLLEDEGGRAGRFEEVKEVIIKYDGFQYAKAVAEKYIEKALMELSLFEGADTKREVSILQGLAQYVLAREK